MDSLLLPVEQITPLSLAAMGKSGAPDAVPLDMHGGVMKHLNAMDRAGYRPTRQEHLLRTRSMGKYSTWLAMVAIALTMLSPVISQILASHASVGEIGFCGSKMGHENAPDEQPPQPDPMSFCSYCTLFHHASVLPSVPWQPSLRGPQPDRLRVTLVVHSPFVSPLLSAAPRGPPFFVQV